MRRQGQMGAEGGRRGVRRRETRPEHRREVTDKSPLLPLPERHRQGRLILEIRIERAPAVASLRHGVHDRGGGQPLAFDQHRSRIQ